MAGVRRSLAIGFSIALAAVGMSAHVDAAPQAFDPAVPPSQTTPVQLQRNAFDRLVHSLADNQRSVAWYDSVDDSTHLPVVGLTPAEMSAIRSTYEREMPTKLVIEVGDTSVSQLETIRDLVLARLAPYTTKDPKDVAGGRAFAGLSTDRGKSFVDLHVTPIFEATATAILRSLSSEELAGRDASIIHVTVAPLDRAENWSGPPLDSGDWILLSPQTSASCSAGYILGPQTYWGITAGHCQGVNNTNNTVYWTNSAGTGLLQAISPGAGWTNYTTGSNNSVANDVTAYGVPFGSWQPYSYSVWSGVPLVRYSSTAARNVRGVRTAEANMVIGLQLCHSGWGSKAEKCGTVTGQNFQDYQYIANGSTRTIDGVYSANYSSSTGDSGGPVFWKWTYAYVGDAEPTGAHLSGPSGGGSGNRYFETMQDIEALLGRYTVAQAA